MSSFGLNPEPDETAPKPQVAKDLIANLVPRKSPRPISNLAESDKAAADAGFTSRDPSSKPQTYVRPTRRRRTPEQSYPLSMRTPVSILERFIAYAEERKLSYPLALESLLDDSQELARIRGERR